jgi:transposase InsO family protein
MTVGRYKRELLEKGIEWVPVDDRKNSGRRTLYEKAYRRCAELKAEFPRYGGREMWVYLVDKEGFDPIDIPSQNTIDAYLSEKKLTHPVKSHERNSGFWLNDKVETHNDRVGMDEKYPFYLADGRRFKVLDMRDNFSGCTYVEPFAYDYAAHDQRGIDDLTFASVYMQWVKHCGVPRRLVLDNGGQTIDHGWLPEVARFCIEQGTVLDWEPYGTPTQNASIERWHREIEKRWLDVRKGVHKMEDGFTWAREAALRETFVYPHSRLGRKSPGSVFPIQRWETEGRTLPELKPIGKGGGTKTGLVRMHRRVEQYGLCQLHGEEYILLSPALVGAKVRIDFHVNPGSLGEGTVITQHGEVVATFLHRVEVGCKHGQRLVSDVVTYAYEGGEDWRKGFSQDMYDERMVRSHKNNRSKGLMKVHEALENGQEVNP